MLNTKLICGGECMSVAEILNGESVNVEYKARVPEKSLN